MSAALPWLIIAALLAAAIVLRRRRRRREELAWRQWHKRAAAGSLDEHAGQAIAMVTYGPHAADYEQWAAELRGNR